MLSNKPESSDLRRDCAQRAQARAEVCEARDGDALSIGGQSGFILSLVFAVAAVVFIIISIMNTLHKKRRYSAAVSDVEERLAVAEEELLLAREARGEVLDEIRIFLDDYLVRASDSYHQMIQEIQNKAVLYQHLLEEEKK